MLKPGRRGNIGSLHGKALSESSEKLKKRRDRKSKEIITNDIIYSDKEAILCNRLRCPYLRK